MFGTGEFGTELFAGDDNEALDLSGFWIKDCGKESLYNNEIRVDSIWDNKPKEVTEYTEEVKSNIGVTRCEK